MRKITKDEFLHLGEEHKDEFHHLGEEHEDENLHLGESTTDENFHLGEFEQALPTFEYNSKEHRYMPSRHTRMDAILGL